MPTSYGQQLQNPKNIPYEWNTDTTQKVIDLNELIVALPRHSFPTIDYPDFIGKREGLQQFFKNEPVIAVALDGKAKAYPLNMLTMHEISNDKLADVPILPTYCPLCNASVVYDRRLSYEGKEYVLEFEVSGMLRNSDMVMADKQTETWWQQLMGYGLVGKLAGVELTVIPSLVISLEDFFERYPDGRVLSPDTDTRAESGYGQNPYVGYDAKNNKPYDRYFDASKLDDRLPPMERVIDLKGEDGYRIYPFSTIAKEGVINDAYDDQHIVIFYKKGMVSVLDKRSIAASKDIGSATMFSAELDGRVLTFDKKKASFVDQETSSTWDLTGRCIAGELQGEQLQPMRYSNHFAFAWLTFYPNSEIYGE